MWAAVRPRALVDVFRIKVVVVAGIRERADRVSESVVARPAEPGALELAGLDRDQRLLAVGRPRLPGGVAVAAVASLGVDRRGGDRRLGSLHSEREVAPSL